MKVKSLKIEGMHKVESATYLFEDSQYLTGENGAGKTTVMQAIQLGLLGYIPGTGKRVSDIFKHANPDSPFFKVSLTLEDIGRDVLVERTWVPSKNTVNNSVKISPESYDLESIIKDLELPIFNFNDLVGMTSNTMKDWFINFLPKSTTSVDWEKEIKELMNPATEKYIDQDTMSVIMSTIKNLEDQPGTDQVRSVNQYLKNLLSDKKIELSRNENTIQNLVYYDDFICDKTEEDLKLCIEHANNMSNQVAAYNAAKFSIEEHNKKLAQYKDIAESGNTSHEEDEVYIKNQKEIQDLNVKIEELDAGRRNLTNEYATLSGKASQLREVIDGGDICPYTKESCSSIETLVEKYKADLAEYKARQVEIDEELKKKSSEEMTLKRQASRLDDECRQIKFRYQQYLYLLNEKVPVLPNLSQEYLEEDWSMLSKSYTDMLSKLLANQQYNKLITELTNKKYATQITIDFLKEFIKRTDANGLQAELANDSFNEFSDEINKYVKILFKGTDEFSFNLSSAKNSFSFGIKRGDKFIPWELLSSGEKCMLAVSLMICIVRSANSPLNIIMIDDMLDHLDDNNIIEFVNTAKSIEDVQFIFAGVKSVKDTQIRCIEVR